MIERTLSRIGKALKPHFLTVGMLVLGALVGGVIMSETRGLRTWPAFTPASGHLPQLYTNQQYLEDSRLATINLSDVDTVFAFVFSQLADVVRVYPTENYYYWRFFAQSQEIWGNIRLDAGDRDQGVLHFAYFGVLNRPQQPEDLDFTSGAKVYGVADRARVVRQDTNHYTVSYRGKTVAFLLHDLSQQLPGGQQLPSDEQFMARTFDESGWQFVLVYDEADKQFRFILDATAPLPDVLQEAEPGLFIGRNTGFAFFNDGQRKILISVDAENVRRNNYFDGPFDQLADNYITGTALQAAMEAAYPYTRGRIDERGVFRGTTGQPSGSRLALTPHQTYDSLDELKGFFASCMALALPERLACLTYDYKQDVPAQ